MRIFKAMPSNYQLYLGYHLQPPSEILLLFPAQHKFFFPQVTHNFADNSSFSFSFFLEITLQIEPIANLGKTGHIIISTPNWSYMPKVQLSTILIDSHHNVNPWAKQSL